GVRVVPGIDHGRLRRLERAPYAVESRGKQPAQGEIRIGGGVARLELRVGGAGAVRGEGRGDPHGALAVVRSPRRVGGAPEMRLEAVVGIHGRAGQREQRGQMLEDTRYEVIAERAHPEASLRVVHERATLRHVPEAPVDVTAVARLVGEGL